MGDGGWVIGSSVHQPLTINHPPSTISHRSSLQPRCDLVLARGGFLEVQLVGGARGGIGGAEPAGREAGGGVVDEEAAGGGEGAGGAQVAGAAEAGGEESLAELLVVLRVEAVGIDYRGRHVAGEGAGEEAPQARLSHPDQ